MSSGPKLEKFENGPGMIGIPLFLVVALIAFINLVHL